MAKVKCPKCLSFIEISNKELNTYKCSCGASIDIPNNIGHSDTNENVYTAKNCAQAEPNNSCLTVPKSYEYRPWYLLLLLIVILYGISIKFINMYTGEHISNAIKRLLFESDGFLITRHLIKYVVCLVPAFLIYRVFNKKITFYNQRFDNRTGFVHAYSFSFCFIILMNLLYVFLVDYTSTLPDVPMKDLDVFKEYSVIESLIVIVVLAPVFEEFIFRGLLLELIEKRMGMAVAILTTSTGFALAHGVDGLLFQRFFVGIAFGLGVYFSGSIIPAILIHATVNFIFAFRLLLEKPPFFSIIILIVLVASIVFSIIFIVKTRKKFSNPDKTDANRSFMLISNLVVGVPLVISIYFALKHWHGFLLMIGVWIITSLIVLTRKTALQKPYIRRKVVARCIFFIFAALIIYIILKINSMSLA